MRDYLIGMWIVGVGVGATALALTLRHEPPAAPPLPKASRVVTFDTLWERAEQIPLARAPFIPTTARIVKIEQVIVPEVEPAGPPEVQPIRRSRGATRDICRGKGRVWLTKHKWRCKR